MITRLNGCLTADNINFEKKTRPQGHRSIQQFATSNPHDCRNQIVSLRQKTKTKNPKQYVKPHKRYGTLDELKPDKNSKHEIVNKQSEFYSTGDDGQNLIKYYYCRMVYVNRSLHPHDVISNRNGHTTDTVLIIQEHATKGRNPNDNLSHYHHH